MSRKYLKSSDMYNPGMISQCDNLRRLKQGLDAQMVASACANCDLYNPTTREVICRMDMYPAKQVHWNYGMSEIPDWAECAEYLQGA